MFIRKLSHESWVQLAAHEPHRLDVPAVGEGVVQLLPRNTGLGLRFFLAEPER